MSNFTVSILWSVFLFRWIDTPGDFAAFLCLATKSGVSIMLYPLKFWMSVRKSALASFVSAQQLWYHPRYFHKDFTQMWSTVRQHAEHMNCNSSLPTFGVIVLYTLNNSHFCHVLVSALLVENHLRYYYEISHKCIAPWDNRSSGLPAFGVVLLWT